MSTARLLFVAGSLALSACVAGAQASRPRYATRDQLRECLDKKADLKERLQAIEDARVAREAIRKRLAQEGPRLRDMKAQLDRTDASAVAALKQAVETYNADATALNRRSVDEQSAVEAYNADSLAVNDACDALDYRSQDVEAVLKERRKPASAASR